MQAESGVLPYRAHYPPGTGGPIHTGFNGIAKLSQRQQEGKHQGHDWQKNTSIRWCNLGSTALLKPYGTASERARVWDGEREELGAQLQLQEKDIITFQWPGRFPTKLNTIERKPNRHTNTPCSTSNQSLLPKQLFSLKDS